MYVAVKRSMWYNKMFDISALLWGISETPGGTEREKYKST